MFQPVAAVDVSKIARELDFQCLQENIMNITFCDIEAEMVILSDVYDHFEMTMSLYLHMIFLFRIPSWSIQIL